MTRAGFEPFWITEARTPSQDRVPLLRPRFYTTVMQVVAIGAVVSALWTVLASIVDIGFLFPAVLGAVTGVAGLLGSQGLMRWNEIEMLEGFSLLVDADGVRWTGGRAGRIAWNNISCLAIVGAPLHRRIWIARRGRWQPHPERSRLTSSIMRLLRLEGLELDVPLRHLKATEAELVGAIRAASFSAFPTTPTDHTKR